MIPLERLIDRNASLALRALVDETHEKLRARRALQRHLVGSGGLDGRGAAAFD